MPDSPAMPQSMPCTAERRWAPPPRRPRLGPGTVHVWRADLEAVSDDVLELLSPEERARGECILREGARRHWMRSHGLLRVLLGRYLSKDPQTLRFAKGAHGKPALILDLADRTAPWHFRSAGFAPPSFNLSHSGSVALYAFAARSAIGVDVEVARRRTAELALAARAFGPAEEYRLRGLDPESRRWEFLRAWVRYEASLKHQATGIGGGAFAGAGAGQPWICDLDVGSRAAAAVALDRPPRAMRCWDWPPV